MNSKKNKRKKKEDSICENIYYSFACRTWFLPISQKLDIWRLTIFLYIDISKLGMFSLTRTPLLNVTLYSSYQTQIAKIEQVQHYNRHTHMHIKTPGSESKQRCNKILYMSKTNQCLNINEFSKTADCHFPTSAEELLKF